MVFDYREKHHAERGRDFNSVVSNHDSGGYNAALHGSEHEKI
jgi:hypothetical protein